VTAGSRRKCALRCSAQAATAGRAVCRLCTLALRHAPRGAGAQHAGAGPRSGLGQRLDALDLASSGSAGGRGAAGHGGAAGSPALDSLGLPAGVAACWADAPGAGWRAEEERARSAYQQCALSPGPRLAAHDLTRARGACSAGPAAPSRLINPG
jgi:hypothetical protein